MDRFSDFPNNPRRTLHLLNMQRYTFLTNSKPYRRSSDRPCDPALQRHCRRTNPPILIVPPAGGRFCVCRFLRFLSQCAWVVLPPFLTRPGGRVCRHVSVLICAFALYYSPQEEYAANSAPSGPRNFLLFFSGFLSSIVFSSPSLSFNIVCECSHCPIGTHFPDVIFSWMTGPPMAHSPLENEPAYFTRQIKTMT